MQELKPTQENLRLLLGQAPAADLTALKTAIIWNAEEYKKGISLLVSFCAIQKQANAALSKCRHVDG